MDYKRTYNYFRNVLAAPFVWAVLFPLLLLDLVIEIYHQICFPLYNIPKVKRSAYIKIDRYKLPYLKWWERVGCLYCEYANGFLRYAAVIAAETERYWCSIKHQADTNFIEPEYQKDFIPYGDEKSYETLEERYQKLQDDYNKLKKSKK